MIFDSHSPMSLWKILDKVLFLRSQPYTLYAEHRPLRYLLRQLVGANTRIVQKQYNKHVSIQFHSLHQFQLHLGPLDSMAHWLWPYSYIHWFILSMKCKACLFQMMLVIFLTNSQQRCNWMVQHGWFCPRHFHPHHLTGHHFLPYHLHYHIHADQVQDQPTTRVDLFLTFYKIITRKFLFYYFIHTL